MDERLNAYQLNHLRTKSTMGQKGYLTNLASEFYVLSVLSRLGYDASLTLGNRKRVDITVVLEEGIAVTIDVKAVAGKMDWLLGNSIPHVAESHFIVLVSYEGDFENPVILPRVWIAPSTELSPFIKIAGNGKTRYLPRKAFLETGKQFENAWSSLKKVYVTASLRKNALRNTRT